MQDRQLDNSTVADRLIAAHDGDVALLYIYLRRKGAEDLEQAARDLCRTMQEIQSAREKLQRMGLWDGAAPAPVSTEKETPKREPYPLPADELPSYTARDIAGMAASDSSFASVCEEAVRVKGRQLSSSELGILAGIYNYLALPAEVIFMLLNYCLGRAEERQPGSRPSFRAIQQEAFHWANLEILTIEQADDYIRRQKERSSAVGRIQRLLGLSDHKLTAPERRNINAWLDMGFGDEVINLARAGTPRVCTTGRPSRRRTGGADRPDRRRPRKVGRAGTWTWISSGRYWRTSKWHTTENFWPARGSVSNSSGRITRPNTSGG